VTPLLNVLIHLFQLQPGGILLGQTTSPENNNYSKSEYTNTQQDLPDQKLPLDMPAFGWWVSFAKNN
jgi:hypothetical protein